MWRLIFATSATSGNLFFFATCVIAIFLMQRIVFQRFGFVCGTWCLCFFVDGLLLFAVFLFCVCVFSLRKNCPDKAVWHLVRGRCFFLTRQCCVLCVVGVFSFVAVWCFVCGRRAYLMWHCRAFCLTNFCFQCASTSQNYVFVRMFGLERVNRAPLYRGLFETYWNLNM